MITIIIPCLNERKNIELIKKNITLFKKSNHLIVDGNSKDNSKLTFIKKKINFIVTPASRGLQLRKGAEASKTKWLLFLHADTKLSKKNISQIYSFISSKSIFKVGFFKVRFRKKLLVANFISGWANLRTKIFKLPFGDQCLLISRQYYFKLGGHSKEKVMEDIEFIMRVPKKNRFLLKSKVSTSFRRFEKNGILLQGIIHLICQLMFLLNLKRSLIYKVYYRYDK